MAKITQEVPFAQVANAVLQDKNLSFKAKGLFAYMFSKPDNWEFAIDRIAKEGLDGIDSIRTGLNELEHEGYLVRRKLATGRIDYYFKYQEAMVGKTQGGKSRPLSNKELNTNKEERVSEFKKIRFSSTKPMQKAYNEDGTTGEVVDLNGNVVKTAAARRAPAKKRRISSESLALFELFSQLYQQNITKKPLALNLNSLSQRAAPFIKQLGLERMKELCIAYLTTKSKYYHQVAWSPYVFLTDSVIHELNAKN